MAPLLPPVMGRPSWTPKPRRRRPHSDTPRRGALLATGPPRRPDPRTPHRPEQERGGAEQGSGLAMGRRRLAIASAQGREEGCAVGRKERGGPAQRGRVARRRERKGSNAVVGGEGSRRTRAAITEAAGLIGRRVRMDG